MESNLIEWFETNITYELISNLIILCYQAYKIVWYCFRKIMYDFIKKPCFSDSCFASVINWKSSKRMKMQTLQICWIKMLYVLFYLIKRVLYTERAFLLTFRIFRVSNILLIILRKIFISVSRPKIGYFVKFFSFPE